MSSTTVPNAARHLRVVRDDDQAREARRRNWREQERDVLNAYLPAVEQAVRELPRDSRWRPVMAQEARLLRLMLDLPLIGEAR